MLWVCLNKPRYHPLRPIPLQWYLHAMSAAWRDFERFAFQAAHLVQHNNMVAGRMNDFELVADLEFIFHVDLGKAARATDDVADILLAEALGVSAHIVLLFVGVVAFVEAVGVTSARQCIQRAQQAQVERAACHGVIDRLAVNLRGARDVIDRFGAAFDFQRIDADFDQSFDMFGATWAGGLFDALLPSWYFGMPLLGYRGRDEMIHRDDLVLL